MACLRTQTEEVNLQIDELSKWKMHDLCAAVSVSVFEPLNSIEFINCRRRVAKNYRRINLKFIKIISIYHGITLSPSNRLFNDFSMLWSPKVNVDVWESPDCAPIGWLIQRNPSHKIITTDEFNGKCSKQSVGTKTQIRFVYFVSHSCGSIRVRKLVRVEIAVWFICNATTFQPIFIFDF